APLLSATWEAGIVRRFVRHLAVLLAIVAAVLALRVAVGEGRAADLKGSDQGTRWSHVPAHVLQALWTGPQVSLAAFAKRPVRAAREAADPNVGLGVAAAFAAIFAVLAPASLFGFQLVVQRGFVRVAELQREYWWRIVGLVPDLAADTVVILMGSEPSCDEFIGTSSWADTWVLAFLFHDAAGRSPFLVGGR